MAATDNRFTTLTSGVAPSIPSLSTSVAQQQTAQTTDTPSVRGTDPFDDIDLDCKGEVLVLNGKGEHLEA
ncbi:hypothetical protein MEO41_29240, partial [Dolichospermum sp. ST_sed4]|nr:hypothetical protein [Dolichospermum sp. ST_sed4]